MQFCSSAGSVLILLLVIFITGSESAAPVVVEYKGSAVLPCTDRCSGVISWTLTHKSSDILAECNQTSCRSLKEGYQMIYNQYLQGDFSLIIPEADFSKRGRYTCDCDGIDKCDEELQIETQKTSKQIQSGDSLLMELDVSDPVEVIYISTGAAAGSSVRMCTVIEGSLQCKLKYKDKTSLLSSPSTLELRDMKVSDSGVYTIRIVGNKEDVHIYTVTVTDSTIPTNPAGVSVLTVLLVVVAVLVAVVVAVWKWKVIKKKILECLRCKQDLENINAEEENINNACDGRRQEEYKDELWQQEEQMQNSGNKMQKISRAERCDE